MIMKKSALLLTLALSASSLLAQQPVSGAISDILELQPAFSFDLTFVGESGVRGCVGDFNNDGIDDFIVTGLHNVGTDTERVMKSFFRVYLGQREDIPLLAYQDDDFGLGGNGSVDCEKFPDGSWMVAVQGGTDGNWTNPFKAYIYQLTADETTATLKDLAYLDRGTGRGSIRILDVNNDGRLDVFQHSWIANASWDAFAIINENLDDTNEFFEMDVDKHGIRPTTNTFAVKGDIDGDGKIDILLPIQGVGLFAYINNGNGTFTEILVTPFAVADREDGINIRKEEDGTQADLMDVDNDGKPEIVMAGTVDNTGGDWKYIVKIYKYSDGAFTEIPAKNKNGEAIEWLGGQRGDFAIADFDGDGNQDFILGVENQNSDKAWGCRTYYFSGNGDGGFNEIECTMSEDNTSEGIAPMCRRAQFGQFLVGDFNGDGKPDLIQAGTTYYAKLGDVRFYANVSKGGGSSIKKESLSSVSISVQNKNLYVNGASGTMITVFDLSGIVYKTLKVVDDSTIIPLGLSTGIYFVKVVAENNTVTEKIAIK